MQKKSTICSHAVTKVIKNSVYVWHVLDNLCRRKSDPLAMVEKLAEILKLRHKISES